MQEAMKVSILDQINGIMQTAITHNDFMTAHGKSVFIELKILWGLELLFWDISYLELTAPLLLVFASI